MIKFYYGELTPTPGPQGPRTLGSICTGLFHNEIKAIFGNCDRKLIISKRIRIFDAIASK
jgi:hypothetical protein